MSLTFKTLSNKSGMPPGSLIHVGAVIDTETRMSVTQYNKDKIEEHEIESVDEVLNYKGSDAVTWLVVEGLSNTAVVERIGAIFGIHQLVLEDILNTQQRPKFEDYDDYFYIVLKSITVEDRHFTLSSEQVSILLVDNVVIVFKEKQDDLCQPIQRRIRKSKGQIRTFGADYLIYTILDTIVDQYFHLLDSLEEVIGPIEDGLLASEISHDVLKTIQRMKRQVSYIRRYVSPVRELLAEMLRSESELIQQKTDIYLRDVADHTIRVIESIDSYRDIMTGLLEMYTSVVSNKMNEIMKVLTIFASIFIPLTFIVGIYGMNFDYMPELHWKWAYPVLWGLFIVIPVVLLVYFKRKKWL